MLQKYDTLKSISLLAFAAAGGLAFAPAAMSESACQASNGYDQPLSAYVAEASACIESSDTLNADLSDQIIELMNTDRIGVGLMPLQRRASLDLAAAAHALDMAARDYASHQDKEGRDHLYRMRAFDRTVLFGDTGANVLITEAGSDANAIYVSMLQDQQNGLNLVHDGFSDVGLAVVQAEGRTYTVQVFATVEGELNNALPLTLARTAPIRATLADPRHEAIGWGLTDQVSGELLARGGVPRLRAMRLGDADTAALDIVVTARTNTLVLKGPLVSAR
ncbi:MAG: CAP domain-containing protein [Henriciella sp.]|nr:CAP domain-containing protein [Henriciella sp.]